MTLAERLSGLLTGRSFRPRPPASSPLLFLHVPKTAGTSFRLGLVDALGARRCHFDYGIKQRITSKLVLQHAYRQPDLHELGQRLMRDGVGLLGGHFGYRKYAALFRADHVVAFCRHPREQLLSHYAHMCRHGGYRGDLAAFLDTAHGAGCQTRAFSGFALEGIGLLGVTERYADSLRLFESVYGLRIEARTLNVNPDADDDNDNDNAYQVPEALRERFEAAVAQDLPVWRRAGELLDARLAALDAGHTWVHGRLLAADSRSVNGFAWHAGDDAPVTLELRVNGEIRASDRAVHDRPHLRSWSVPRNAYVGFDFRGAGLFAPGDEVTVCVSGSGQLIGRAIIGDPAR